MDLEFKKMAMFITIIFILQTEKHMCLLGIVFEKEYFDLVYSRFLFGFEHEP